MSEQDVKKNFSLSADFNKYLVEHPDIAKDVPQNACIVFITKNNQAFANKNREMAKEIMKRQHRPCFGAVKEGNKWTVTKLQFAR